MYKTISESEFKDAFLCSETYKNNFSYEALTLIFNWIEEYDEDCKEHVEFDMVAICCDFKESSEEMIRENYGIPANSTIIDYLDYNTSYIGKTGTNTYVYLNF